MAERASRRAILAAAAAAVPVLAAGCKGIALLGPPPRPGAEVNMLDRAITAEKLLIARYHPLVARQAGAGTGTSTSGLVATLAAVYAQHQEHLRQLQLRLILPPRLATASPAASPSPPALPANDSAALVAALATAERAAATRLQAELLTAPPALAQLMASIAASEAVHAVVITKAGLG